MLLNMPKKLYMALYNKHKMTRCHIKRKQNSAIFCMNVYLCKWKKLNWGQINPWKFLKNLVFLAPYYNFFQ